MIKTMESIGIKKLGEGNFVNITTETTKSRFFGLITEIVTETKSYQIKGFTGPNTAELKEINERS